LSCPHILFRALGLPVEGLLFAVPLELGLPEILEYLIAKHEWRGRMLREAEVYELLMARPEFRGLVRCAAH